MPLESSPEQPLPLRTVARAIADWVGRLGRVWVEGQVAQVNQRPGQGMAFLTLRDSAADVSMQVTAGRAVLAGLAGPLREGARVVCWVQPEVWAGRGTLRLTAYDIREIGLGELLARLEALKKVLAAEGLFAPARKRPLPFLPRLVGLVTGRAGAAERDVVENARRRWPGVRFEVRQVAVQGAAAVPNILGALRDLNAMPEVDVIVLARGGGSVEDLLPFSDETLCRAVAACRTPVVSAIGHEPDTPLVDFVADVRCSTPTDAGKRIVPDVTEEKQRIERARTSVNRAVLVRLAHDRRHVEQTRDRLRRRLSGRIEAALSDTDQLRARVRALSPLATLERGYAVLLRGGAIVRSVAEVSPGDQLAVRLADGTLHVRAVEDDANPNDT